MYQGEAFFFTLLTCGVQCQLAVDYNPEVCVSGGDSQGTVLDGVAVVADVVPVGDVHDETLLWLEYHLSRFRPCVQLLEVFQKSTGLTRVSVAVHSDW